MVRGKSKKRVRKSGGGSLSKKESHAKIPNRKASTPFRLNSLASEKQGMKIFLISVLSVALLIILTLILFFQEGPIAGEAVSIGVPLTCGEGDICLTYDKESFSSVEVNAGDTFTVTVMGYTEENVNLANLELGFSSGLNLIEIIPTMDGDYLEEVSLQNGSVEFDDGNQYLNYSVWSSTGISVADWNVNLLNLTFSVSEDSLGELYQIAISDASSYHSESGVELSDGFINSGYVLVIDTEDIAMEINYPPEISLERLDDTIVFGDMSELIISVSDMDGDDLAVRAEIRGVYGELIMVLGDGELTDVFGLTPISEDGELIFFMDSGMITELGDYVVKFTVTDGTDFADAGYTFNIVDEIVNSAPYFAEDTGFDQEILVGEEYLFSVQVLDDQDDMIFYEIFDVFSGTTTFETVSADVSSGEWAEFVWTPTESDLGSHTFKVQIDDGTDSNYMEFVLEVVETLTDAGTGDSGSSDSSSNSAPYFDGDWSIDLSYNLGETVYLTPFAFDDDGDELTMGITEVGEISSFSETATITDMGGVLDILWIPSEGDVGGHSFSLWVSDGEITTEEAFTITIVDPSVDTSSTGDSYSASLSIGVTTGVTSGGIEIHEAGDGSLTLDEFIPNEEYMINVDLQVLESETSLPEHLLLVQVEDTVTGEIESLVYQWMDALSVGEMESLSFSFVPGDSSYSITAYAWSDFASSGGVALAEAMVVSS